MLQCGVVLLRLYRLLLHRLVHRVNDQVLALSPDFLSRSRRGQWLLRVVILPRHVSLDCSQGHVLFVTKLLTRVHNDPLTTRAAYYDLIDKIGIQQDFLNLMLTCRRIS